MKKLLALASLLLMSGCQVANDVKDQVVNTPPSIWNDIKEVLQFLFDALVSAIGSWLTSLLG